MSRPTALVPVPAPDVPDALAALRARIDAADAEILALLNRRAALSLEVGVLKNESGAPIFCPARETELLNGLSAANPGPLREEQLRAIYREILSASRALQQPIRVAFLGPEGTFSHMACLDYFGRSIECAPMPSLAEVFTAVQNRVCDLGVIPLENSLHGTVAESLDLFADHEVVIQAELYSRINLALMSRETRLSDVHAVYSHAQPLGQCAAWLAGNLPGASRVAVESTAAAAFRAAGEAGAAAIGHAALAEPLGLHLLKSGIEDSPNNWTRFFIVGPPGYGLKKNSGRDKSSIMFVLADKPGGLAEVLNVLGRAGINMTKLESRPRRDERWKYLFFADLECDVTDRRHAPMLDEIRAHAPLLRILGAYPGGNADGIK